jgi:hypothetical protein
VSSSRHKTRPSGVAWAFMAEGPLTRRTKGRLPLPFDPLPRGLAGILLGAGAINSNGSAAWFSVDLPFPHGLRTYRHLLDYEPVIAVFLSGHRSRPPNSACPSMAKCSMSAERSVQNSTDRLRACRTFDIHCEQLANAKSGHSDGNRPVPTLATGRIMGRQRERVAWGSLFSGCLFAVPVRSEATSFQSKA